MERGWLARALTNTTHRASALDALMAEEVAYLEDEIKRDRRCRNCAHLLTFHQYAGGGDRCVICGCE